MLFLRSLLTACLCALATAAHAADEPAKYLFAAKRGPAEMPAAALGSYAKGCLAGGVMLPESGPGWQAVRLGRNRNWGHPELVAFIGRLSAAAQAAGWPRIFVADLAQPRGGPMRSGHASHQIGLDADIWLRKPPVKPLSLKQRENIKSHVMVTGDGLSVTRGWTPGHHRILKAAASDPAVARIFVNAAIKRQLCRDEPEGPGRAWLRKIRPWWRHNAHFHVRLRCPAGSAGCVDQAAPPPGDGCDKALEWWFSDEALHPKPGPKKPRRELTMADLPAACASVLAR